MHWIKVKTMDKTTIKSATVLLTADLNNDGRVNIGDAMLLGTAWGHTA